MEKLTLYGTLLLVPEQLLGLWKGPCNYLINTTPAPGPAQQNQNLIAAGLGWEIWENVFLKARSYQCTALSFPGEPEKVTRNRNEMIKPALLNSAVTCLQSVQKLQLKKRETESGRGIKESLPGALKLLACKKNTNHINSSSNYYIYSIIL